MKGRSSYNFIINCDPNAINNLINNYLDANNFALTNKKGETFYKGGDAMLGYKGFSYTYNGNNLIIYAWVIGALGDFNLESNTLNIVASEYRNSLNSLFLEIEKLNNGGMNMNNQYNQNNMNNYNNQNYQNNNMNNNPNMVNSSNTFYNENIKKKETMCEIGFWLSLAGLLASFLGVAFGIILYILDFYFAAQGLKTRKKGKAVATIVLSIVSIIIIIIEIVATYY